MIVRFLSFETIVQSSQVHDLLCATIPTTTAPSLVTIKRDLEYLTETGWCTREGQGRATGYRLTPAGRLQRPFDVAGYVAQLPDTRTTYQSYNPSLFTTLPNQLIPAAELTALDAQTNIYQQKVAQASSTIQARELERFIIEFSWKSSAIEGNTYTLFDAERLIREGVAAPGHHADEAQMILNHKRALEFVLEVIAAGTTDIIQQRFVEQVHELLIAGLGVGRGLRASSVGITGSAYTPLDTKYQIREALEELYTATQRLTHPIERALLILAGISYIQPFEDGNKRTARLVSNAALLAHAHAPLSYRNVDIEAYRGAMLVFYEQHSLAAVRDIFVGQYHFSTKHYLVQT